jgi:predicted nuclease of restriction endonuclease-like RecB superfamily
VRTLLPSELLAVWKRKGIIWPRYAKLLSDNLKVASDLIKAYKNHEGEKKKSIKDFAGELEGKGYDYRFIRGLSFLLDRRSTFRCGNETDPPDLRRRIYQAAGRLGLPTTPERRSQIIRTVASDLGLPAQTIEESMYADLDSELVLEKFESLSPHELLEEYNLSLTQTLLFDSTELNFTAAGNWQTIFYVVKRLGLIYEAYQDGRFWVKIDGPASLFKLTRRYGTSIAKLLPAIIANPEWTVEAKILWKYTNEICNFKIESWKHRAMLKSYLPHVSYDSIAEEDFAARFQALKSEWQLKREPEPVLAGKQVIIPDFSVERGGVRVYIEIVGFWTMEYLLRKIEKLKMVDVNMIIAVNESLACEKLADLEKHARLNIIYYRDRVPLAPIIRYLEEASRGIQAEQTELLKNLRIVFTEPVVDYEEFAERIGVSSEAVITALAENPPADYVLMHKTLVRKDKIEQIGKKLEEQKSRTGKLVLAEAVSIAETEGVEEATSVLEALGYKVAWHGISPEKAEIFKPESKNV